MLIDADGVGKMGILLIWWKVRKFCETFQPNSDEISAFFKTWSGSKVY